MNLTLRYSFTQFTYWAASTGAASFATIYLLDKGMSSSIVGILLALTGISSCFIQPVLAAAADRSERFILKKLMLWVSLLCMICYSVQLIEGIPLIAAGMIYTAGLCASDAMVPILNALSVAYNDAGYRVNYSAARGIGSLASGVASLVLGRAFTRGGALWMMLFLLGSRLLSILFIAGFPKIEKKKGIWQENENSCLIWYFFSHYKWYCISLLAILFLGMFHAMTENYLIAIMQNLGGNSSHVGIAIFIASITGAPVIFFYSVIREKIRDTGLLKIAAVSFLIKAIAFYFAPSVHTIYGIQFIQMTSYALLGPAQVYYAKEKVKSCDMVKGQAFITAAYALGCSLGNFMGGQMLQVGVKAMLISGIVMAVIGTVLMFATVDRRDERETGI